MNKWMIISSQVKSLNERRFSTVIVISSVKKKSLPNKIKYPVNRLKISCIKFKQMLDNKNNETVGGEMDSI